MTANMPEIQTSGTTRSRDGLFCYPPYLVPDYLLEHGSLQAPTVSYDIIRSNHGFYWAVVWCDDPYRLLRDRTGIIAAVLS